MTLLINYTESPALEPTEEEIRERAYQLWLSEGKPEGRDFDHWLAARQTLLHEALAAQQAMENVTRPGGPRPFKATVKLRGAHSSRHIKGNATAQAARTETGASGSRERGLTRSRQPVA